MTTTVTEVYDLLDELRDPPMHRTYQQHVGGNQWLLSRPSNDSSLHEVRFRSFKPLMKQNVIDDYNDLFLTVQCTPFICGANGTPVYEPGYQLFLTDGVSRLPLRTDLVKVYFGKSTASLNDHMESAIDQFLEGLPRGWRFTFGDPSDSSTFVESTLTTDQVKLSMQLVDSPDYAWIGSGTWIQIGQWWLMFSVDVATDGWYVTSTSRDLMISSALSQLGGDYLTDNVGTFVQGFDKVYKTVLFRVSMPTLILCSTFMNNLSTRVFAGQSEPSVRFKVTDVGSSQNYIAVSLETFAGSLDKKIIDVLANVYEAIIVELDWVYDRVT